MRKLEMGTVLIRAYLTNKQISQIRQIFSNLSIFGTQVFPDDIIKVEEPNVEVKVLLPKIIIPSHKPVSCGAWAKTGFHHPGTDTYTDPMRNTWCLGCHYDKLRLWYGER
jgi:hypothetical protein